MPISEDTVTTSPERVSLAVPEEQTLRTSDEWEEPHPGQRYSVTVLGNARPGATNCNGVGRAGMAAKAYSPYPTRATPGSNRRFAPPRLRTPSLRPHKDTARLSVQTTCSTSSTLPGPQTPAVSPMYGCAAAATNNNNNNTATPMVAAAGSSAMDLSSSDDSSVRLSMTDFSGFLKPGLTTITTNSTDASSYMDIDDSEKHHPRLSPDDEPDPYGWEAELEKRVDPPPGDFCPMLQYRRAGGARRSLLQRVLSFGPAGHKEG